jgi:hypothetical protein
MLRRFWPLALLVTFAVGCNPPSGSAPATTEQTSQPAATPSSLPNSPPSDAPDKAVYSFLEAVRTGNDQQAAKMLTPMALQKTSEMQMEVAPTSSPTAKFNVGQTVYREANSDGAYVDSTWTDKIDDEGHTRTDAITWVLRRETEGWRIAGMVTKVFPDRPPLILNFEDPEDMMRKQELLRSGATGNDAEAQPTGQPQATKADSASPVAR